jgi:hypothetical protein
MPAVFCLELNLFKYIFRELNLNQEGLTILLGRVEFKPTTNWLKTNGSTILLLKLNYTMEIPIYKDYKIIGFLLMGNVFKQIKQVATIHDAAVDAGIVESEKIGKYIPNHFSAGSTANTIASIAKAGSHAKRVKSVAVKMIFLGVSLAGSYFAMNKNNKVNISERKCKKIHVSENLTIKNKFNSLFKYHKDNNNEQTQKIKNNKKSIVDIVKEKQLSARKK